MFIYTENNIRMENTASEEDFDKLEQSNSYLIFIINIIRQGKFVMFVAGKLPANLEQLLNEYFGDLAEQSDVISEILFQYNPRQKKNSVSPMIQKECRVLSVLQDIFPIAITLIF